MAICQGGLTQAVTKIDMSEPSPPSQEDSNWGQKNDGTELIFHTLDAKESDCMIEQLQRVDTFSVDSKSLLSEDYNSSWSLKISVSGLGLEGPGLCDG